MINRSAVLVRPRQPFLDWATAHGGGLEYPSDDERTVYLLPDFEDDDGAEAVLQHFYDIIFEEELSGWMNDPSTWPENRNYEMFLDWFEVEQNSVVQDIVDGDPLEDDED